MWCTCKWITVTFFSGWISHRSPFGFILFTRFSLTKVKVSPGGLLQFLRFGSHVHFRMYTEADNNFLWCNELIRFLIQDSNISLIYWLHQSFVCAIIHARSTFCIMIVSVHARSTKSISQFNWMCGSFLLHRASNISPHHFISTISPF